MAEKQIMVKIDHVSKEYRLGAIGGTTLREDLERFHAKIRKKEDPTLKIGQKTPEYGKRFMALKDISFEVEKGEAVGIIGHNGAGKSTLIRHLTGIYKQDEGSVLIDGEPVFENPAVKEKMALDVDVAKLKLLKANHMNNQYRLEDDIARNFPQQIAKLTEIIDSYKADIAHFSEYKITDPEQFSMEISGKVFTEKKEAGAALLAVCKEIKSVDAAMDIGSYQGFNMRIQFDSWSKEFILSVKHESVAKVRLGADALGNITRINNLLESYPEKLAEAEQRLETVQEQMTNAKEEVGKPFPKEEELNQKLERLSELNALLNMDEREDTETEQSESKEKEERPARGSIHEKLQIYKEKSQRESETGKETRKRDFGLE